MAQLLRRRMDDDATDFSKEWDSANVGYAIAVSIGAGLATGLGGALVFFPKFFKSIPQSIVLGVSLALSAGVMLYVSFIEIFGKSLDAISQVDGINEGGATAITTVSFFFGMFICVLLEILVHWISKRYGGVSCHSNGMPCNKQASEEGAMQGAAHSGAEGAPKSAPPSPPPSPVAEGGAADASSIAVDVPADSEADVPSGDVLSQIDDTERQRLKTMGAMTALAIAIHNFPEGLATFLATVADTEVGLSLGIAIAVHNIPEGICVAMPIYYATGNKWRAFGWSILSGVTEPIGGILGFAALQPVFTDLVFGMIFAMVGGMMVFIVLHELLPAAHRYMNNQAKTTAWLIAGMVIMSLSLVLFVQ